MKGKTDKTNILTERQKAVLETIRMRLTEKEALEYLRNTGFEISDTTWYREKKQLEKMKLRRLYHIAKIGFEDQHLERIDNCELIQKLMWQNVKEEKDPYKRNQILKDILSMQPYLSSYYEATKEVMKESAFMKRYYVPEFEISRDTITNSKNSSMMTNNDVDDNSNVDKPKFKSR
jgi:hypothetical protein